MTDKRLVHTTKEGVQIFVTPGKKSRYDFRVTFQEPGKRERTPKHVHLIVELYVKEAHNKNKTKELAQYLLGLYDKVCAVKEFPPKLQVFKESDMKPFLDLNEVGEFSVEFMLVVTELIFIQERTNYNKGWITKKLYHDYLNKDRFTVVNWATAKPGFGR